MKRRLFFFHPLSLLLSISTTPNPITSFLLSSPLSHSRPIHRSYHTIHHNSHPKEDLNDPSIPTTPNISISSQTTTSQLSDRRSILTTATAGAVSALLIPPQPSNAAVGTLPEYANTNAILQGITINVADESQQQSMIDFLILGFNFKVLRRGQIGSVTDTWLGFGPEQLSIPSEFELPVSSFQMYGGHASIHIRYDAKSTEAYYKGGDTPPGDSIAFLQVGVPAYRISQMVKTGGNVLDAYGLVNVISPVGLPMRGIVGISPDPIMFLAIQCQDVSRSRLFYEQLGMVEQPYPYARPSKGASIFEPAQPPKSVYLSHSPNSMGILLLQAEQQPLLWFLPPKPLQITPNPVLRSLNVVYAPKDDNGGGVDKSKSEEEVQTVDPSGVPIAFVSVTEFEEVERVTRIGDGSRNSEPSSS